MSHRKRKPKAETTVEGQEKTVVNERVLKAKTPGQQNYIDTINNNSIIFCNGVYGTGKSHIAVGKAIEDFRRGRVSKIVISRPTITACGEELASLPGNVQEKMEPFVQSVMEEMYYFATPAEVKNWRETGKIEIVPIALLRGRNFHYSFVVIDEAANLTFDQILLILTRIGKETTLIFSGDYNQCDLPRHKAGAFKTFMEILSGMESVGMCELTKDDIVRSPFIREIMERIEKYKEKTNSSI